MDPSVDINNLRDITGGDTALENELFSVFLESAAECMAGLQTACARSDEIAWRNAAHAFKGISLNLGAMPLSALCKNAQDSYQTSLSEKQAMLAMIQSELERVRAAVEQLHALSGH